MAYVRLATWPNSIKANKITKRKKKIFAIPAAAAAIPVKPSTAEISAIRKKINAQRSIVRPP